MDERQERDARGVGAECSRSHVDGSESVSLEQLHFKIVPAAFGTDGEHDSFLGVISHGGRQRHVLAWMRHETKWGGKHLIQVVLYQYSELPVN